VTLDANRAAQASFTVTNMSAQTLRGRLLAKPVGSARLEWFSVAGESVREFAPNAAERVVVALQVPLTEPPGSYSFRLDAISELAPDEDVTEGPSVAFDVTGPAQPKPKKLPWWIWVIIGAVVLLIIIIVIVLVR
jgi:hypothetical protein